MKQIIDGKVYNTDTATLLFEVGNGLPSSDFAFYRESYYKTKKGNYFAFREGGACSQFANYLSNSVRDGDEFIEVCDINEVQEAALLKESDLDVDGYEALFGEVEEA